MLCTFTTSTFGSFYFIGISLNLSFSLYLALLAIIITSKLINRLISLLT